jgi:hypothetical protein
MNRLFFESNDKFYSISFPFQTKIIDGEINFSNHHLQDIDFQVTSNVISIINDESFKIGNTMYDFMEDLSENKVHNYQFWNFILHLFLMEDGYVRFDHDRERMEELKHPENHFDVFYSQHSTWKIGLPKKISLNMWTLTIAVNILKECKVEL